jgi:hypothetical protein
MGEMIPYGVYFCDINGGLKYASSSFLNMIQMTMEERGISDGQEKCDRGFRPYNKRWLACVKTEKNGKPNQDLSSSDNSIVTIQSRARPVRDKNGEISGWAALISKYRTKADGGRPQEY